MASALLEKAAHVELLLLTDFCEAFQGPERGGAPAFLLFVFSLRWSVKSSSFWLIKLVFDRPAWNIQHPDE